MSEPLSFAVVTPSYNQVRFVERTIRSVLEQNVEALEYVVIDGGSSDGTVEILQRYAPRVQYVSEPDDGQADAVNKGIARTTGELIGWLNSDDVYYRGALRAVRSYFADHPEIDVVYGNADHIDEDDRVIEPYYCEAWDPQRLRELCFLCQPAVFFRRRVVDEHGLLDDRLDFCLDYEYWLRLADRGARFAYLPRKLAGSRLYAATKTLGQRVEVHAEINEMLKRRLGTVPDRWLSNWAHVVLERRGLTRDRGPLRFALAVSALSWCAALRWNHRVSSQLWRTTRGWIRGRGGGPEPVAAADADCGAEAGADARANVTAPARSDASGGARRDPASRSAKALVGLDVSQTGTRRAGCGYVSLGMAQALERFGGAYDFLVYPTFGDAFWDSAGPDATWTTDRSNFRRGPTHRSRLEAREFWEDPGPDLDRALGDPDIVHSQNFFCPRGLRRARLLYTLYDLSFLVHPEWTTEANRRGCFDGVFQASLHADFVVSISEWSRWHFLELFPHYPEERTAVVHPASRFLDSDLLPPSPDCAQLQPDRFFLSVGTLEPRKNLMRLTSAYAAYARRERDPMPLVLVGDRGWLTEGFEQHLRELNLGDRIIRLGYVDDATLGWLYRSCHSFLYPALFEGFGLPVVEALSQGAAVVTSRATALPEAAGDAALYVDATDQRDIERALVRVAADDDLRAELRAKAVAQAARFTWQRAAERMLDCYARVSELEKLRQTVSLGRSA